MINLNGKVALITGGSRGIGAAVATKLAEAGAGIAITYQKNLRSALQTENEVQSYGVDCISVRANVSLHKDVRRAVQQVVRHFGRLDLLVNNAGIWTGARVQSMTEREWDKVLDINLKGTFLFTREVFSCMKKNGGKIINVSSTAGQRGEAYHSHYAASKGGVIAFTKSVAVEYAPFNIQVNCVAPGWVDTDMSRSALANRSSRRAIEKTIPRGVVASADDIAGPVLFLASDLSDNLVGATLSVNGGSVMVA